jgi:hypothetical protein
LARHELSPFWIWMLTIIVVLGGLVFQRVTAPSYPLEVEQEYDGRMIRASLGRSQFGTEGQRIVIEGTPPEWEGILLWRSVEQGGAYQRDPLRNLGTMSIASIPPQPRGEQVEYRIEFIVDNGLLRIPRQGTVITHFKGAAPAWVVAGHVLLIYCGLLFGARAGLDALNLGDRGHFYARLSLLAFILGGFLFGPLLKGFAYGRLWGGPPLGADSTDMKTLALVVAWSLPVVFRIIGRQARPWILLAALLSILAFLMPHTMLG